MMTNKSKNNSKIKKTSKPRKKKDVFTESTESKVEALPEASPNVFILPPDLLRQLGIQINKTAENTNNDGTEFSPAIIYDSNLDTFKEKRHNEIAAINVPSKDDSKYKDYDLPSNPLERKYEEINTKSYSNQKYENNYKFSSEKSSSIMETVTLMKSSLLLSPSFELIANDSQYKSPIAEGTDSPADIPFSKTVSDSDSQPLYRLSVSEPETTLENMNSMDMGNRECLITEAISETQHSVNVYNDETSFSEIQSQKNHLSLSDLTGSKKTTVNETENLSYEKYSMNNLPVNMNEFKADSLNAENVSDIDCGKDGILTITNVNIAETPCAEIHCELSDDCVDTLDSFSDSDDASLIIKKYKQNEEKHLIPVSTETQEHVSTTNINWCEHIQTNSNITRTNFKISIISDEIVKPGEYIEVRRQSQKSPLQSVTHSNDEIVPIDPLSKTHLNEKSKDDLKSISHGISQGHDSQYNTNNNIMPVNQSKSRNTCIKESVNSDPFLKSSILENVLLHGLQPINIVSTSHAISNVIPSVEPSKKKTETCLENCTDVEMLSAKISISADDYQSHSILGGKYLPNNIQVEKNYIDISLVKSMNESENLDSKDSFNNVVTDETQPGGQNDSTLIENPPSSCIESPKSYPSKQTKNQENVTTYTNVVVENKFNLKNVLDNKIILNSNEHHDMENFNINRNLNETGTLQVYKRKQGLISPKNVLTNEGNVTLLAHYIKAAEQACHRKYSIGMDSAIKNSKKNIKRKNDEYISQRTVINTHGVEKPGGINSKILNNELSHIMKNSMTRKKPLVFENVVSEYNEEFTEDNNRFSVSIPDKIINGQCKINVKLPSVVSGKKELECCNEKCSDDKDFSCSAGQSRDVYEKKPELADHPRKTTKQLNEPPTRCLDTSVGQHSDNSTIANFENSGKLCEGTPITQSINSMSVSPNTNELNIQSKTTFHESMLNAQKVQPRTYSRKRSVINSKDSSSNLSHSVHKEINSGTKLFESEKNKNLLTDTDLLDCNGIKGMGKPNCTEFSPGHSQEINISGDEISVNNHKSSDTENKVFTEFSEFGDMKLFDTSEDDIEIHIEVDDSSNVDASDNVNSIVQINKGETSHNKDSITDLVNIKEKSLFGENPSEVILHGEQCIDELNNTTTTATRTFSLYEIGDDVRTSTVDESHVDVNNEVSNTIDNKVKFNISDNVIKKSNLLNESKEDVSNEVSNIPPNESNIDECNVVSPTYKGSHVKLNHEVINTTDKNSQVPGTLKQLVIVSGKDKAAKKAIEDVAIEYSVYNENKHEVTNSTLDNDDNITHAENEALDRDNRSLLDISKDALQIKNDKTTKRKRGRPQKTVTPIIEDFSPLEIVSIPDNNPPLPKRKSLRAKKSLIGNEFHESEFGEKAVPDLTAKSKSFDLPNTNLTKRKSLKASLDVIRKDVLENRMSEIPAKLSVKRITNAIKIEGDSVRSSEDENLLIVSTKNKSSKRKRRISSSSEEDSNKYKTCRKNENSIENKGEKSEADLGKCAICLQEIKNSDWLTHRREHNDLAWREGEQAIDLTDSQTVYEILHEKQRSGSKVHVCDKCGVKRLSIAGFMSHLSMCQKTKDEIDATREECLKCHNLYLPSCIKLHTRNCQGPKEKKVENEPPKQRFKKRFDIRVEEPPADQKNVKCAVCFENMKSWLWQQHLKTKHYYLAWFEGGTPLDLTDECFMISILNKSLKANKVLVCYRCGEKRGSAYGLICHLTICEKTEQEIEELKITCTVCERRVMPYSLRMHMNTHAPYTSIDKKHTETPDKPGTGELDEPAIIGKSGRQMRKAAIKAEKVIQEMKVIVDTTKHNIKNMYTAPSNGTVRHIRLWNWQRQLDKSGKCRCHLKGCSHNATLLEDMITHHQKCPYRQTLYSCKICDHECEKEDDIKNHVEKHVVDEKNDHTFDISKDFAKSLKNMYTPPWSGVTNPITIEEWKRQLLTDGTSSCPNEGCEYLNASQDDILKHYEQDCQHHSLKYTCKLCNEKMETEDETKLHIRLQHRGPGKKTGSDSSCSSGSDDDNEEECGQKSDLHMAKICIKKVQMKEKPQKIESPNMEKYRKTNVVKSLTDCMGTYYKWMNEMCDFHFTKSVIFPEFPCSAYHLVPPGENFSYLPPIKQSCNFAHATINRSNADSLQETVSFKTYHLFEGDLDLKDSLSFFVGGAVTALSWAPLPVDSSATEVPVQYLAVCTQRDTDATGLAAHSAHSHPALIQIWSLGHLENKNKTFNEPASFVLGIAHDYGTVWSLDWCPSGGEDGVVGMEGMDGVKIENVKGEDGVALRRMGLLAAACSNGSAYIFAVCYPKFLPNQPFPIYKTTPAVELRLMDPKSCNVQATCVHWSMEKGHHIVAVGYSDGIVALFDLHSTSVLLRTHSAASNTLLLAPYFNTQLLCYHVTALFIYPRKSSTSDRSMGILLGAASYVCAGVWARVGVGKPREVMARKQNTSSMVVTPHWPSLLIGVDDSTGKCCSIEFPCRAWSGSYALVQQADEHHRQQSGGGEGCAVACCAWTGLSAVSTNNGIVTLSAPQHPLLKQRHFKIHMTICQLVELPKQEDNKKLLEVESYADTAQEYGIVVRDAPVWNHSLLSAECHRGRDFGSSPNSRYPLASVTRLAFCPSQTAHAHLAQGLQSGLVHVTNMRSYNSWRYSSAKGRK